MPCHANPLPLSCDLLIIPQVSSHLPTHILVPPTYVHVHLHLLIEMNVTNSIVHG
jgi:hypothetical protein